MILTSRLLMKAVVPWLGVAAYASGITVTKDGGSAEKLMRAIQNTALTRSEALSIAQMQGNQGAIRKLNEFKIPASTESLANALYATAHGEKLTNLAESSFYLDVVRTKAPQLLRLVEQIETNPDDFQAAISRRIEMFTPPLTDVVLHGYVVAAGDGGGYAFGTTDFYLNLGIIDELVVAKNVASHELYYAVQGAFADEREQSKSTTTTGDAARPGCSYGKAIRKTVRRGIGDGSRGCLSSLSSAFFDWNQEAIRPAGRPSAPASEHHVIRDVCFVS
jgi:hypothetical protein